MNFWEFIRESGILLKAELLLRLVIAILCGAFIGYERTNRGKGAGIRTHTIVAVASCLMVIISQYGFEDFFNNFNNPNVQMRLDPSRVAAQIVSGIGFLGAGMIFIQKNMVMGLTTAAGIWAVAGIGMAIGCGMYFIGIISTALIVVVQIVLHKNSKLSHNAVESELEFVLEDREEALDSLLKKLKELDISILEIDCKKNEELLNIALLVQYNQKIDKGIILEKIYEEKLIESVKI